VARLGAFDAGLDRLGKFDAGLRPEGAFDADLLPQSTELALDVPLPDETLAAVVTLALDLTLPVESRVLSPAPAPSAPQRFQGGGISFRSVRPFWELEATILVHAVPLSLEVARSRDEEDDEEALLLHEDSELLAV
jgi:hypothetical protein